MQIHGSAIYKILSVIFSFLINYGVVINRFIMELLDISDFLYGRDPLTRSRPYRTAYESPKLIAIRFQYLYILTYSINAIR